MQKITVFALLYATSVAFAMHKQPARNTSVPIPFKKQESFFSKVLNSNPLRQIDIETVKNVGKKVGKAALCVFAIFLPSMYADVTIGHVSHHLVELGMTSVKTMIPDIVHTTNTVIASGAAFKCAEMFSSHSAARFSAALVGGISALYTSGQLNQITEPLHATIRHVTDREIEEVINIL